MILSGCAKMGVCRPRPTADILVSSGRHPGGMGNGIESDVYETVCSFLNYFDGDLLRITVPLDENRILFLNDQQVSQQVSRPADQQDRK